MEVLWGQGVSDVDIFNLSGFGRGVCGNGRGNGAAFGQAPEKR